MSLMSGFGGRVEGLELVGVPGEEEGSVARGGGGKRGLLKSRVGWLVDEDEGWRGRDDVEGCCS